MPHQKGMSREFVIDIANWGCKPDNTTANHLVDIINNNETQFIKFKLHKLLIAYYRKMCGLMGTGQYQEYYMMLVRQDTMAALDKLEISNKGTHTHTKSLILIIYRTIKDMDYDENNQFPKC